MKSLKFVIVLFLVVTQFALPHSALADDTTPPPDTTEETQPADSDAGEDAPAPQNDASLDMLPDDVHIVVTDSDNQPLPLATQAAAEAIATSDPAWCPDGASLSAGECVNYPDFTTLITGLNSLPSLTNGTVYVQAGNYSGPETSIIFDGNYLPKVGNLSLLGGWDINTATYVDSTNFSVPISFTNWTHDLTIQDINIDNTNGTGLAIQTTKPVTLININSTRNTGNGIDIKSNAGVTLDNVHASNNGGDGLVVKATPEDYECEFSLMFYPTSTYVDNMGYEYSVTPGLSVIRRCFLHGQSISILSNSEFNENGGNGMTISTAGSLSLSQNGNTTITGNGKDGLSGHFFYNTLPAFPWSYYQNLPYSELIKYMDDRWDPALKTYYQSLNYPSYSYDVTAQDQLDLIIWQIPEAYQNNIQQDPNPHFQPTPFWGGSLLYVCFNNCILPPTTYPILGGEKVNVGGASNNNSTDTGSAPLCAANSVAVLQLPSGDNLTIYCPVNGALSVNNIGKKKLPASLPDGYVFLSALEAKLSQNGAPVQVITDAGHLKVSFVIPSEQVGKNLVILFWDTSTSQWIELPILGLESSITLPNSAKVLEGVQVLNETGLIEVSVNFPGIFALAVK